MPQRPGSGRRSDRRRTARRRPGRCASARSHHDAGAASRAIAEPLPPALATRGVRRRVLQPQGHGRVARETALAESSPPRLVHRAQPRALRSCRFTPISPSGLERQGSDQHDHEGEDDAVGRRVGQAERSRPGRSAGRRWPQRLRCCRCPPTITTTSEASRYRTCLHQARSTVPLPPMTPAEARQTGTDGKGHRRTRSCTLTPLAASIARSSTPARIIMPTRVRARNHHSPTPMAMAPTSTASR